MLRSVESVHVHKIDSASVVEEYRRKGYVLVDEESPTIITQAGFLKLTFALEGSEEALKAQAPKRGFKRFFHWG